MHIGENTEVTPDLSRYRTCGFLAIFTSAVTAFTRWDEKAGLHGMRYAPNDRRAFKHKKRRPAMKKISTVQKYGKEILKEQKLTIGVDLGDRWSFYCVLDANQVAAPTETRTPP